MFSCPLLRPGLSPWRPVAVLVIIAVIVVWLMAAGQSAATALGVAAATALIAAESTARLLVAPRAVR